MATTLDRGTLTGAGDPGTGYADRWTVISLTDADSSTYASSSAAFKVSETATSIQSLNTVNGYIAQWTNINPGIDGDFSVRFTYSSGGAGMDRPIGSAQNSVNGYGPAVFSVEAVPEPATLSLIGLAALPLIRRRRA